MNYTERKAIAEREFRARVAILGGTVTGVYVNMNTPVAVTCKAGHSCNSWPTSIARGNGLCRECAGKSPEVAEREFRARVVLLGGTVTGGYVNNHTPVAVTCKAGHSCNPRPTNIASGDGPCRECARISPEVAEREFRACVALLGGTVTGVYVNSRTSVAVTCKAGHSCNPRPVNICNGQGICPKCAGKVWDVFYIVENLRAHRVKFGITSGNPKPRLDQHARYGYAHIVKLLTSLPHARDIETAIIADLRLRGYIPVSGREYYDSAALNSITYTTQRLIGKGIAA